MYTCIHAEEEKDLPPPRCGLRWPAGNRVVAACSLRRGCHGNGWVGSDGTFSGDVPGKWMQMAQMVEPSCNMGMGQYL